MSQSLDITNTQTFLTSVASQDTTIPLLNQRIPCNQLVVMPGAQAQFTIPSSTGLMLNPHLRMTMRLTFPAVGVLPTVGGGGVYNHPAACMSGPTEKSLQFGSQTIEPPELDPYYYASAPTAPIKYLSEGGNPYSSPAFISKTSMGVLWKTQLNTQAYADSFFTESGAPQATNPYFNNAAYPYDAFLTANMMCYPQIERCQNYNASKMSEDGIYLAAAWAWNATASTPAIVPMPASVIFSNYSGSTPQYATDLGMGGYLNLFTQMDLTRSDGTIISQLNNQTNYCTLNWLKMLTMTPLQAKLYDKRMGCGVYHMADALDGEGTIVPGTWATDKCSSYEYTHLDPVYRLPTAKSEIILTKEVLMPLAFPLTDTWPIEQFCGRAKSGEAGASVQLSLTFAPHNRYMWRDRPRYYNAVVDSLTDAPTNFPLQPGGSSTATNKNYSLSPEQTRQVFYNNAPLIRDIQWLPMYPSLYNALPGDTTPTGVPGPAPVSYRSGNTGCVLRVLVNAIRMTTNQLEDVLGAATLTLEEGVAMYNTTNAKQAYKPGYPMCSLFGGFTVYTQLEYLDGPVGSMDNLGLLVNPNAAVPSQAMIFNATAEALRGRRTLRHESTAIWIDGNNIESIQLESRHAVLPELEASEVSLRYDEREPDTTNVVIRLARTVELEVPVHDAYFGAFAGFEMFNCSNGANDQQAFPNAIQSSTCAAPVPTQYFFTPNWTRVTYGESNASIANCTTRPHFRLSLLLATQSPCMKNMTLQGEVPSGLVNPHRGYSGYAAGPTPGPTEITLYNDPFAMDTDDNDYNLGSTRPCPRMIYPKSVEFSSISLQFQKGTISDEHRQLLTDEVQSAEGLGIVVPFFTQLNVPVIPGNPQMINFIPTVQNVYGIGIGMRLLNELDVFGCEPGIPFCGFSRVELTRGAVKVVQKEAWELLSRIGTDYPVSLPAWTQFNDPKWTQNPYAPRKGYPTLYDFESINALVGAIYGANPLNPLNNVKETNLTLIQRCQSMLDYFYVPTAGGAAYVAPGTTFNLKFTLQKDYETSVVTPILLLGHLQMNSQASLNGLGYRWLGGSGADTLYANTNYVRFWDDGYNQVNGTPTTNQPTFNPFQLGRPAWDYSISAKLLTNGRRFNTPALDAMVHQPTVQAALEPLYVAAGDESFETLLSGVYDEADETWEVFPVQKVSDYLAVVGCQQIVNVGDCSLYYTGDALSMLNMQITIFHQYKTLIRETSVGQGVPVTSVSILT
jgi:hypothetical protein